jgi:hypothetical protein
MGRPRKITNTQQRDMTLAQLKSWHDAQAVAERFPGQVGYRYEQLSDRGKPLWTIEWDSRMERESPIYRVFRLLNQHLPAAEVYNGVEVEKFAIVEKTFQLLSLWFIKEERRNPTDFEYPFCHSSMKHLKYLAQVFLAELDVCQFIHDTLPKGTTPYKDHWDQWLALLIECKDHNYRHVQEQWKLKSDKGIEYRNTVNSLRNWTNPVDQTSPHYFNFYETAIALAKHTGDSEPENINTQFNRKEWKSMLSAYSRWATKESRGGKYSFRQCYDVGDSLFRMEGSNPKQLKRIFPTSF